MIGFDTKDIKIAPYNKEFVRNLIIVSLAWAVIAAILIWGINQAKEIPPVQEKPNSMAMISGNSLVGVCQPAELKPTVLTSLVDDIIQCESGGDPEVCNQEYGCKAGMGLFQLIPSTVKYCEEKLGRELDPFEAEDNMACGMWLINNEGTQHWGTADTDWGSYQCWAGK